MNAPSPGQANGELQATEELLYEARKKIYMRSVTGVFANWRWAMVWLTQIIFYGLPWLQWEGRQAVLLDLVQRKFYFFGLVLWPQDVIFLALLLIISAYGLFLFTAIAGRLFCGYACPQTVYTQIFMWIERKVEGDRLARIRLDAQPMDARKFARKSLKHGLWAAVALWTGFTFVGYFTSIHALAGEVVSLALGPWETFWILFYGFATYGNAGFMREQVCKYMCPYARFQSVMFDRDTLIVTYDPARGEPRGKRKKDAPARAQGKGDCVDCSICVQVCPTGIDIREGLQYMCIGCGACIDACDQVMDKMNTPRGLIRYSSENALLKHWGRAQQWAHLLRPRILIYSTILLLMVGMFIGGLVVREPVKLNVMRDRRVLAREIPGGMLENLYQVQLMNASEKPRRMTFEVKGLPGLAVISPRGAVDLAPSTNVLRPLELAMPTDDARKGVYKIEITARSDDGKPVVVRSDSTFIVP
ncbi:MAG: cytochrome c oxidase accessory protein CcoG [Thiomonas sp. 13-66-29]|jgi:cytochrome c oxidase accessory protein FixG|uniref:cytochrome c oxidase accessory protein CcoG n=1 Tax=Thiomonas sp. TaxID=2047785 RepID=UPI000BDDE782|nr:cytochrome c oxidase accessory protein CcoG [Thiomonas sp.]OZB64910.1 MAG: cytochrome c oxidase accessory protein CcoG [Thiomonas sp. 13-66-29]